MRNFKSFNEVEAGEITAATTPETQSKASQTDIDSYENVTINLLFIITVRTIKKHTEAHLNAQDVQYS